MLAKISNPLLAAIATQLIMEGIFPVHCDRQAVLTWLFSRAAKPGKETTREKVECDSPMRDF